MNIMEIVSGAGVNGAVVNCMLAARELARRGHQITFVCPPRAWAARQLADNGIHVVESDLHRWPLDELRRIAALCRKERIDVVHTHMSRANFFGVLLRWFSGVPTVAAAQNRYIQLHWMFNDRVIAASAATARYHHRYNLVRNARIAVVHNFFDPGRSLAAGAKSRSRVRNQLGIAADTRVILAVGDVIRRKGLIFLVRAMPRIIEVFPDTRLLVVGGAYDAYESLVRRESQQLGVSDQLIWAGHREDIPDVLTAADIYALPTLEDNLPLAILEAMAAGLPVVSTTVGGIPECVEPHRTGYLVPPADSNALADALTPLLSNEDLCRELGRRGQLRVQKEFSPDSQVPRIEAVLAEAAELRRRQFSSRAA